MISSKVIVEELCRKDNADSFSSSLVGLSIVATFVGLFAIAESFRRLVNSVRRHFNTSFAVFISVPYSNFVQSTKSNKVKALSTLKKIELECY